MRVLGDSARGHPGHGMFVKPSSPSTSRRDVTGLTIPRERGHATGGTTKIRELSDPHPSSPSPRPGRRFLPELLARRRPQQPRTKRQHQPLLALLSLFTHLAPSTARRRYKACSGVPRVRLSGFPSPHTKRPLPLTSTPRGFSMSPNSFHDRHQVQEAILASPLFPSALIGRLPEPRANHASRKRNSRCRPRLRPSSP